MLDDLLPGEQARFRGVAKFKKNAKRKRKKIAYRTNSQHDAAMRDAAKVILKRKKR